MLKRPDTYGKEAARKDTPRNGYLNLIGAIQEPLAASMYQVDAQVGDFYMFPNYLDHCVYPFKSKYNYPDIKGERRSFSLNIVFSNVEKDRNKS